MSLDGFGPDGVDSRNAGKGVPEERDRTRRYDIIRGWSEGLYFLEAKLLVCCARVLMT